MRSPTLIAAIALAMIPTMARADIDPGILAAAEQGDAEAQNQAGEQYYAEQDNPENFKEALKWYRRAAEQGHADAQYAVGVMFFLGKGAEEDYTEAVKWYRLAADQGNMEAQRSLGHMYTHGLGVTEDDEEGVKWYRLAAQQGSIRAINTLGHIYRRGLDAPKDFAEATKWFRLGIEQGDKQSQKGLDNVEYDFAMDNSHALTKQKKYAQAEPLFRKVLDVRIGWFGEDDSRISTNYSNLASNLHLQGKNEEAEKLFRKTLAIRRKSHGEDRPEIAQTITFLADVFASQGRFAESAIFHRRALKINRATLGDRHEATSKNYAGLAAILMLQGRLTESLPLLRKSYEIARANLGDHDPGTLTLKSNFAEIYARMRRYQEAETLSREVLETRRTVKGDTHLDTAESYQQVAGILLKKGDYSEGEALARKALQIRKTELGEHHQLTARSYNMLALSLGHQGRHDDASPFFGKALSIIREIFGENHPVTASGYDNFAVNLLERNQYNEAEKTSLKALERARIARLMAQNSGVSNTEAAISGETRTNASAFANYLDIASKLSAEEPAAGKRLQDNAFMAAQDIISSASAQAMVEAAARASAGTGALAAVVREQQDLQELAGQIDKNLLDSLAGRDGEKIGRLQKQYAEIIEKISAVETRLDHDFPNYRELMSPKPLELAEVQKTLTPGEGLLVLVAARESVYSFAVTATSARWHKSKADSRTIYQMIKLLRCNVDRDTCSDAYKTSLESTPMTEAELEGYQRFDLAAAYALYANLIAPVEPALAGVDRLYITSSGSLGDLPLAILTTTPPPPDVDFADPDVLAGAPWLGERYALTKLPAVSALRLRTVAKTGPKASIEFRGYGDPVLAPVAKGPIKQERGVSYYRGAGEDGIRLGDPEQLKRIPSLPGTSVELTAMAALFDGGSTALKMGSKATESALKRDDMLQKAKVVAFATHGLLPSPSFGMDEPGLIFTPPVTASSEDDGILTASEASRLSLSADWVILSACNTASSGGNTGGGDSLSALSRAFLYSGAQALLASHWQVPDEATAALTVETLTMQRDNTELTRAQSLQKAMKTVRTGKRDDGTFLENWNSSWVHPTAWGAFSHIANNDE